MHGLNRPLVGLSPLINGIYLRPSQGPQSGQAFPLREKDSDRERKARFPNAGSRVTRGKVSHSVTRHHCLSQLVTA